MIYTFTLNPTIDKIMKYDLPLKRKSNNKTVETKYDAGGKAAHVSVTLSLMSVPNIAAGFIGSINGSLLVDLLEKKYKVNCQFISQEAETRVSHILIDNTNKGSFMLTQRGFEIKECSLNSLCKYIEENIKSRDICVFAGNPTPGITPDKYRLLLEKVRSKGARLVVDASAQFLRESLKVVPYFIKPNEEEFEELTGSKLDLKKVDKLIYNLDLIHEQGAENIILSLGNKGSILSTSDGSVFRIIPPEIKEKNDTGCGDSFVGGVLAKLDTESLFKSVVFGTAVGTSNAAREETSGFDMRDIDGFLEKITTEVWRENYTLV